MSLVEDVDKVLKACDIMELDLFEVGWKAKQREFHEAGDASGYEMCRSIIGLCRCEKLSRKIEKKEKENDNGS